MFAYVPADAPTGMGHAVVTDRFVCLLGDESDAGVAVEATEEAKAERYPNRIFADDAAFAEGDLSFVDFDAFSSDDFTPGNYS